MPYLDVRCYACCRVCRIDQICLDVPMGECPLSDGLELSSALRLGQATYGQRWIGNNGQLDAGANSHAHDQHELFKVAFQQLVLYPSLLSTPVAWRD
jgi:hypothetical protein